MPEPVKVSGQPIRISRNVQTVTNQIVYRDVPAHYYQDESDTGLIVDILLTGAGLKRNNYSIREDLYDDNISVIDNALNQLEKAYLQAHAIITLLKNTGWRKD